MYVYIYIYINVCIYIYMYIYIYMHIYMYIFSTNQYNNLQNIFTYQMREQGTEAPKHSQYTYIAYVYT
jgi:hypothetical protein